MTKPLSHLRAALIALSEHPPSDPVEAGIAADCARRIHDCVAQLEGVMRQRQLLSNKVAVYHNSVVDKVAVACGLPPLGHVTGHEMRGLDFYGEGGE